MYTNATSIVNKIQELKTMITIKKPHVIGIAETWFNNKSIKNIDGYSFFGRDRDQVAGGGVCIYIDKSLNSAELDELRFQNPQANKFGAKSNYLKKE